MHPVQTGSRTGTYAKFSDTVLPRGEIGTEIYSNRWFNYIKITLRVLTLSALNALSYMRLSLMLSVTQSGAAAGPPTMRGLSESKPSIHGGMSCHRRYASIPIA
jgi:hypothetical protein